MSVKPSDQSANQPPTQSAAAPAALPVALPELCAKQQGFDAPAPQLLLLNETLARDLGFNPQWLRSDEGTAFLTGHGGANAEQSDDATQYRIPQSGFTHPVATAYAGHQFGNFAGLLGDGRALLLGTVQAKAGLTGLIDADSATATDPTTPPTQVYEIQAKGTGPTPFSRGGDGKATLTSALREYLISEAMFAQHIPTTRALAVIATGENIYRGAQVPFDEGSPTSEIQPGGIVVRVATSHLRVGTFELVARSAPARSAPADSAPASSDLMPRLIEFATSRHGYSAGTESLLRGVVKRQADLVARWLAAGFVHGVMNTDNATISGETIDFGPCAFLDAHDPRAVFSSIDRAGRYAFGAQPTIAGWNLARLAEALLPLLADGASAGTPDGALELAQEIVGGFAAEFTAALNRRWLPKIGLPATLADDPRATDLLRQWQGLLTEFSPDHSNSHRALIDALNSENPMAALRTIEVAKNTQEWPGAAAQWVHSWEGLRRECGITDAECRELMQASNPIYIPRNHLVTQVLAQTVSNNVTAASRGDNKDSDTACELDLRAYLKLLDAVTHPFGSGDTTVAAATVGTDAVGADIDSSPTDSSKPQSGPVAGTSAGFPAEFTQPAPESLGAFRSYCGT